MSLDPDEFIATAQLPDDLRLELAAQEPAVVDPVGVAFDADGRMFVVEMGGYPTRPEGSPPLGRVKRLVDEDLDGYYETWTLFADGLPYPTSVLAWRDGVLVTAPPDILHLRDPDGDGVADARDVLFTGFPVENTQHNITLARANGETDTVPRRRIREFRAEGLSLMPDGLEQGLDADGLADLLAYLRQHDH